VSRNSRKFGSLGVSQHYWLPQPVTGIALLLFLFSHNYPDYCKEIQDFAVISLQLKLWKSGKQIEEMKLEAKFK
jgi:hypothetical protein